MHEIAIILINYNTSKYTINCIESIYNKTSKDIDYQIIIVDNCSNNEDYNLLEKYIKKTS
ncbi:glycosyltransferase [uncultured Flavobacterium sp.]|uniref:glycosyltransferase n=1 Tax=uncultured Flavobacterium sp. TaxID=165435 RepID=UPI0030CA4D16